MKAISDFQDSKKKRILIVFYIFTGFLANLIVFLTLGTIVALGQYLYSEFLYIKRCW